MMSERMSALSLNFTVVTLLFFVMGIFDNPNLVLKVFYMPYALASIVNCLELCS